MGSAVPGATAPAPFIVGVGRSGTTLLRLMLDAHPDLAIPGETHFLPDLIEEVDRTGDPQAALRRLSGAQTWPNLGLGLEDLARAWATLDPFSPGEAVRTLFRLYAARFAKPRWGDKTPTYRAHLPRIAHALPEARFIHMIRDGRDVALSYRGLWFGPGDDVEAQARFWVEQITRTRAAAAALPGYMELRFEELVARPGAELARVCAFLDLAFHPAMLAYAHGAEARLAEYVQTFGPNGAAPVSRESFVAIHARTSTAPDPARIGRWRTEMTRDEINRYEQVAAPLLAALGYPLADDALKR